MCRKNSESSRSHMLVGLSICKKPLVESLRGRQSQSPRMRMATMWLCDLCGAETMDMVPSCSAPCSDNQIRHFMFIYAHFPEIFFPALMSHAHLTCVG
jgi:hypothetical protein